MSTFEERNQEIHKRAAEISSLIKHLMDEKNDPLLTLAALADIGRVAKDEIQKLIRQVKFQEMIEETIMNGVAQLHKEEETEKAVH